MSALKKIKVASLNAYTIEGKAGGPCVILLHGYGADAGDLVPLAGMMGLSKDVTWIFPGAPNEVILGPGMVGRAWFQLDSRRLEQSLMQGEPLDMSNTTPGGLESASRAVLALLEELQARHSKVVIGGFSQGAMLSIDVTLSAKKKPAALIIMSGTLICKSKWTQNAKTATQVPFVQTHGKNDALLGYEYAENLHSLLVDAGMHGELLTFSGGHEIPPKALENIGHFLRAQIR